MADTVFLTGVTGFLGGHLARELLSAGYHVRGSLRNPARAGTVRSALAAAGADVARLDFVTLDLLRDEGWDKAAEGARFVIHSASPFVTTMPKDPNDLIRPAVEGTERALTAAARAGVERAVLTSSSTTIVSGRGPGRPDRLGPEDWSEDGSNRAPAYVISKIRAERRAWEIAGETGLDLVTVQPGFIVGPLLDDDPGTSGQIFLRFLRGKVPVAPNLWLHTVDVRDLARIHVAALTAPGVVGHRVPAAFGVVDIAGVGAEIARAAPAFARRMPRLRAPDWFVRLYALFDGDMRAQVNELGYRPHLEAGEAARLLGRPPTAFAQSAGALARSLIERKLV